MITTVQKLVIPVIFLALSAGVALAKKPDSPGNSGKHKTEHPHKNDSSSDKSSTDNKSSIQVFFNSDRQVAIRNYYSQQRGSKHCPPGLAKKNNGGHLTSTT